MGDQILPSGRREATAWAIEGTQPADPLLEPGPAGTPRRQFCEGRHSPASGRRSVWSAWVPATTSAPKPRLRQSRQRIFDNLKLLC